jgi:hypothetical protein
VSPHRGILTQRVQAEGAGGLIFALGTTVIFLIAAPGFRPLVGLCVLGGLLLAPVLHRLRY